MVKYKEGPGFRCPQAVPVPGPFIHIVSLPSVAFLPVSGPRHTPCICRELSMGKPWGDVASGALQIVPL